MDPLHAPLVNNHRQDGWLAVAIIMTIVETIFFGLRIYCRKISNVNWGADDYLAALGYLSCIALNGVSMAITSNTGVGQHTDHVAAVDLDSATLFLKLQIPLAITYLLAAILPKIAIISLFLRIFIQRPFRIACWVVQAILILYLIAGVASVLASCSPFSANWKIPGTLDPGEHCIDLDAQYKAGSYPNIVTDLAIIILPIPVVWKVKKNTSEKIGLLGTFCLGFVGLAFSIARLEAFFTVFNQFDVLWTAAYTGIFTTLEPASYFLVACMMTFRQLLRGCGGRGRSYATGSATPANSASGSQGQSRWGRRKLVRLSSGGQTAVAVEVDGRGKAYSGRNVGDEEWELGTMGGVSAAERLTRAHNRPSYSGMAVVSTSPGRHEQRSDEADEADLELSLQLVNSMEHTRGDLRRVREARAIGVRREVSVSRE